MKTFRDYLEAAEDWQKFSRQKYFPWHSQHDRPFQRSVNPFDSEEEAEQQQYAPRNLYHVTPALRAIKIAQELKSRGQLGGTASGLGGGAQNVASHKISLTYNLGRAKELYEEFHYVVAVVQNKKTAAEIYDRFATLSDNYYDDDQNLSHVDQVLRQYMKKSTILSGDTNKIHAILNKKIVEPRAKYEFLQQMEKAVIEDNQRDDFESDVFDVQAVMGFTSPFEQMQKIDPRQIAIIQCVIRKDAHVEHVPEEAEIRVSPADLAIIRYFQPNQSSP